VRLHGIAVPELGQPFGQASKRALSDLVFGKQVTLHTTGTDRYKRTLAHVTVGDIEANAQMIATGHAWHYKQYDHTAALAVAERNARAARRGLWADGDAVPPWEFPVCLPDSLGTCHTFSGVYPCCSKPSVLCPLLSPVEFSQVATG